MSWKGPLRRLGRRWCGASHRRTALPARRRCCLEPDHPVPTGTGTGPGRLELAARRWRRALRTLDRAGGRCPAKLGWSWGKPARSESLLPDRGTQLLGQRGDSRPGRLVIGRGADDERGVAALLSSLASSSSSGPSTGRPSRTSLAAAPRCCSACCCQSSMGTTTMAGPALSSPRGGRELRRPGRPGRAVAGRSTPGTPRGARPAVPPGTGRKQDGGCLAGRPLRPGGCD